MLDFTKEWLCHPGIIEPSHRQGNLRALKIAHRILRVLGSALP